MVTKVEREEHERTHIPYRCWCRVCAKGRKGKNSHMKKWEEEKEEERMSGVLRVSMDYHFMRNSAEVAKIPPVDDGQ